MMHRMKKPPARQDMDTCPSIAPILSCAFVFAASGFFLRYTTKIHPFGPGSNAELSQERPSLHAHDRRPSGAKPQRHRASRLLFDRPRVVPSLQIKAVRLLGQATQEILHGRRRSLWSSPKYACRNYSTLADADDYVSEYYLLPSSRNIDMLDCHSIVGLSIYQTRVPYASFLHGVSCEEREKLLPQGANVHSSAVHYPNTSRRSSTTTRC
jgi:hypothetical protein